MSSLHKHQQLHELYVKQVKKAVPPNKRNDTAWLKKKIEEATKDNVSVNVNLSVKLPSVSGGSGSTPPTSKKKKISSRGRPAIGGEFIDLMKKGSPSEEDVLLWEKKLGLYGDEAMTCSKEKRTEVYEYSSGVKKHNGVPLSNSLLNLQKQHNQAVEKVESKQADLEAMFKEQPLFSKHLSKHLNKLLLTISAAPRLQRLVLSEKILDLVNAKVATFKNENFMNAQYKLCEEEEKKGQAMDLATYEEKCKEQKEIITMCETAISTTTIESVKVTFQKQIHDAEVELNKLQEEFNSASSRVTKKRKKFALDEQAVKRVCYEWEFTNIGLEQPPQKKRKIVEEEASLQDGEADGAKAETKSSGWFLWSR